MKPEAYERYEVGQLVTGVVSQLSTFGAFVKVEDEVEGLVHVSEFVDGEIVDPAAVVQPGQELILRVIRVDPPNLRMGLSLRRALDTPDAELTEALGEGILARRDVMRGELEGAIRA